MSAADELRTTLRYLDSLRPLPTGSGQLTGPQLQRLADDLDSIVAAAMGARAAARRLLRQADTHVAGQLQLGVDA